MCIVDCACLIIIPHSSSRQPRIWNILDFCKSFVLVNITFPTENLYLINISFYTTIGHMEKHVNQDGPANLKCKILQTKVVHE